MSKKTRIFFASDLHGSEKAFMKFVNSAKFYGADVVILGGDMTGKAVVPISKQSDGSYTCEFLGAERKLANESELEALEKDIRFTGYYPYRTTPEEKAKFDANDSSVQELFTEIMCDGIRRWIGIAEERWKGLGIKRFVTPGNDDRLEIDECFHDSSIVVNPEGKVVRIDDEHEMISTGYSNITPWRAPRDIPEEELAKKIEKMVSGVQDMKNCIFNFHCPPFADGVGDIDMAALVDENLKYIGKLGEGFTVGHVGSKAVREAIETYQPLLGLHGHIHESRGVCKIGRTLCINPGSEYSEGVLRGVVVTLKDNGKIDYQMTSG